jgi:hypothetical protein
MVCRERFSLTPNGPAIKVVSVPEYSGWRGFCHPGTNYFEFYECRAVPRASEASDGGTRFIGSREQVHLQGFC